MPSFLRFVVVFAATFMLVVVFLVGPGGAAEKITHEQQWIVDSIGKDVAGMVLFAAKQKGAKDIDLDAIDLSTKEGSDPAQNYSYELKWNKADGTLSGQLNLTDYAWSPSNYSPWASQLMDKFQLQAAPETSSSSGLIEKLADYNSDTIFEENKRISEALSAHPLDPEWHEQAALLCAVMALRECAACFNDTRPQLNRTVAHLAMARALRGQEEYGPSGKLAEAAMTALCGRTAQSVQLLDALAAKHKDDVFQSWLRALRIRATSDYRIADFQKGKGLEQLEYGRAYSAMVGTDELCEFLSSHKPAASGSAIDWMRIGLRGIGTVESGHQFAEQGLTAEAGDFAADCQRQGVKSFSSSDEANAELSRQPTGCLVLKPSAQLQVLSWPNLCAFHARHLVDSIWQRYNFEENLWGVKPEAKEFAEQCDKSFGTVRLYPLCRLSYLWAQNKKVDSQLAASLRQLIATDPALVDSELWHRFKQSAAPEDSVPDPNAWFVPRFPTGTAFDYENRHGGDPKLTLAQYDQLKALCPYQDALIHGWALAKYGADSVTGDQLVQAYGGLADFDVRVMWDIGEKYKKEPAKNIAWLQKYAPFKPQTYFELGYAYVDSGEITKAVAAFEEGVSKCQDAVYVANDCQWLVDYYYDHGQKDKALKLAKFAAEVYSGGGLRTMGGLYERMGNFKEAERYYNMINERYGNWKEVGMFYVRQRDKDPHCKQEADKIMKEKFPDGLVKLDATSLSGPPKVGVKIGSNSRQTERYQLKVGDIFVAEDGYRTQNQDQFYLICALKLDPSIEATVWDGKAYKVINAKIPDRRFHCELENYSAGH